MACYTCKNGHDWIEEERFEITPEQWNANIVARPTGEAAPS
jgi:hypothetical protein